MANEMLKHYRFYKETREEEREFMKNHQALLKKWGMDSELSLLKEDRENSKKSFLSKQFRKIKDFIKPYWTVERT